MSARLQSRVPDFSADELPDFASNWDNHLAFGGDTEFRDGLLGMGNQFGDQPDMMPPAGGADFSLLHDASPTSPSVHLQPCLETPAYAGLSALTQGLREWENAAIDSAVVSPTMDFLPDDLMASCNSVDSEPFNPLLLLAGAGATALTDGAFSEHSSSNSSVGSIPIPQPSGQAFSEYSFCSEPSLAYTGSSFNSDRSFDVLYAAHKQNQHLAPPQQNALSIPLQPRISGWTSPPQPPRPAHVQRARRPTVDQPRRATSSSIGPNTARNALSFIHFRPGGEPGQLLIHGTEHPLNGKKPRGRKNPLTPAQKKDAALMRRVKACESCRQRKEKCDPGIPCKACIEHFRTDLVRQPCRGKTLEDLTSSMLSGGSHGSSSSSSSSPKCATAGSEIKARRDNGELYELGWCPMERTLDSYFGPGAYKISSEVSFVNLLLGFGPPLVREVWRVIPEQASRLFHNHVVYEWPVGANGPALSRRPRQDYHTVLPAILADTANLHHELDGHLSKLVNEEQYFREFPLFNSPLKVLKYVYTFYRDLPDATHRHLLHTALKLLVLVHISDNTRLDPSVPLFFTFSRDAGDVRTTTPCFIRGQLGAVIPQLARDLLRHSLSRLEDICLTRRCIDWPVVLATLATLCMAVESAQYHAAKEPYHAHFDASTPDHNSSTTGTAIPTNSKAVVYGPEKPDHLTFSALPFSSSSLNDCSSDDAPAPLLSTINEEAVDRLISFYRTCYRGCHCTRLQEPDPTLASPKRRKQESDQDAVSAWFVTSLRASLRNARAYMAQRKSMGRYALKVMGMKSATGEATRRLEGMSESTGSSAQQGADPKDMSVFFDRLLAKLFLS